MKLKKHTLIPALLVLLFGSAAAVVHQLEESAPPPLPVESTEALELLFARPFVLEESYEHLWRVEAPEVRGGFLIVVEVAAPFTIPRNTLESVLYVGEQTAERVNWGTGSGRVVAIVPTPLDGAGQPVIDWASTPIWYGSPELPERVDAARITEELAEARAAGIQPVAEVQLLAARERGGELLALPGRFELERYTAELIIEFSPSETERAEGMLAPLVE